MIFININNMVKNPVNMLSRIFSYLDFHIYFYIQSISDQDIAFAGVSTIPAG